VLAVLERLNSAEQVIIELEEKKVQREDELRSIERPASLRKAGSQLCEPSLRKFVINAPRRKPFMKR
jgi:hypothetical protein